MGGPGSGAKPRKYPEAIVAKVRRMYTDEGRTIREIQAVTPGVKVQNIVQRFGLKSGRPPRDQRGHLNPGWKGDAAGYQALHLRVESALGKPAHCMRCGLRDPEARYEWANLTGAYADISDYERMCVWCHRQYDAARRAITGRHTSPKRR